MEVRATAAMSEYQYIAFRAIDGPVSEKNLRFMRRQSTRADITPWSFENEYHFGDFGGNAAEMLRRGYDFHLHYANFGVRTLTIRLADGLPNAKVARSYLDDESLSFAKDKNGKGGILWIQPAYEPGTLEELFDPNEIFARMLSLRAEIMAGDLRPLYLAHLAVARSSYSDPAEVPSAPVPAGLGKLSTAQRALAEFYEIGDSLIAAAARGGPESPPAADVTTLYEAWVEQRPEAAKNAWICRLMSDSGSTVGREILAEFQRNRGVQAWPTAPGSGTVADLEAAAERIESARKRRRGKRRS